MQGWHPCTPLASPDRQHPIGPVNPWKMALASRAFCRLRCLHILIEHHFSSQMCLCTMQGKEKGTGMATQKNTIEIVRATIDDLELIVPLFDGYRQFYKQASDLEGARSFLKAHFEQDTSVIFLAFSTDEAGQRQASGFTQLYPSFSSTSLKRLWILNDLFVAPGARRTGTGTALLEHARQFALATGAKGLSLATAVDNYTAQSVYEAAGWVRDREFYAYHLFF